MNTLLAEMKQFASFSRHTQRYIRISIDNAFGRCDAEETWARDALEIAVIRGQIKFYQNLTFLRTQIPESTDLGKGSFFIGLILTASTYDLAQGGLCCFGSYRFLYERLLGARSRPWLPSAFMAAAAQPVIEPKQRKLLLQSISEVEATTPGWSKNEPTFFPEWVDKVEKV